MPPKKRASNVELSRVKVLAAGDERAFLAYAIELLESGDRLAREAALEALVGRPLAGAREALRALYFELAADGLKRDQGAMMRVSIVKILQAIDDTRDRDIAINAVDAQEIVFGDDLSWQLRVHGLRLLADLAADVFPFYAIELLDDYDELAVRGMEPANTALQLIAGTRNHLALYQWLVSGEHAPVIVAGAFELLADGPREIAERYALKTIEKARRSEDDALPMVLAETIVRRELRGAYDGLSQLMSSKISDELYNYLAVLLAGTNRRELLAILEEQLHRGRRPKVVAEALRLRSTPEQKAILDRWESGEERPAD
jgi:hypothetical protein